MNGKESRKYEQYVDCLKENPRLYLPVGGLKEHREDTAWVVSTHVLAPVLAGFVLWLLKEAVKNKKERLYFLSRDGYLMYRMTQLFCEKMRLPIECRYLSCSRYAVRIPIFFLNQEEGLDYICRDGLFVSIERILRRAGLTKQERQKVIRQVKLPGSSEEPISRRELEKVRKKLYGCPYFLNTVKKHSREAMKGLAGYLRQEGLLDEVSDALVDSGWVGSMQKTLQEALKYLGRERELEGYYFGLYDLPDGMKRDTYHCYYFHPYGGLREKVFFNNCLFEAVFTAPHGMTLGYRREGEVYVPCYGTMGEERRQFVRQTEEWMMEYGEVLAKEMTKKRLLSLQISKERKTARKLLYLFMTTPSGEEARIYGQLSFSDDVLEEEGQPIAPRMTQRELRANHILPKLCRMAALKTPTVVKSVWYEGSAVLGRKHIKRHIRQHLLWQAVRFAVKAMEQTGQKKGGEKDD